MANDDLIRRSDALRLLDMNGVVFRKEFEELPAVDAVSVKHAKWDLLIAAVSETRWEAAAECPICGFMKHHIWAGYFPDVSATTAREITTRYASKVKLPNYCENCGASMIGGETE